MRTKSAITLLLCSAGAGLFGCTPAASEPGQSRSDIRSDVTSRPAQRSPPRAPPTEMAAQSTNPVGHTLTVVVEGISAPGGTVRCALFDDPQHFANRTQPVRSARLVAEDSVLQWVISDLPTGDYAVAVYLDRDENGSLTKSRLGLPREPYGFSNSAENRFGPPTFSEACFHVPKRDQVAVSLRAVRP